jgi:winged helix DNA-binding protein
MSHERYPAPDARYPPIVRRIDDRERRARLALRHHLAPAGQGRDPVRVADELVGIHATEPTSPYVGLAVRTGGLPRAEIATAMFEERTLIRIIGMRRTLFLVPLELAGVLTAACGRAIAVTERKRTEKMLRDAGITKRPGPWLRAVETEALAALEAAGEATATELTKVVPGFRKRIAFGAGKKWAGEVGVSTRVLFLLSMDSRIVRAQPRGTWVSGQYRWAPLERWIGGSLADLSQDEARPELLRRWLRAFGPGTMTDLRWWTGWGLGEVRRALEGVETEEVDLDGGGRGFVLAEDVDAAPDVEPWAALLPTLDTTIMGWFERDWYLGPYRKALFDTAGNGGPSVWWDGRIVGGWGQGADNQVVVRLLEDVGSGAARAIEAERERLDAWVAGVRVTPRFRTPLEIELSGRSSSSGSA